MIFRKTAFVTCLIVSVLCLAAGYWITGQWIGAVIAIAIGLGWLLARKYPLPELQLICLLASVGMAAIGRLTGSPPLLMICGSGTALAVWDLLLLDVALEGSSSGEQAHQYENNHLQSLILALGLGLFLAFLGRVVTLDIPFVLLVPLIALAVFSLDRVWGYIKKQRVGR
jgi:hypothetical protein